MKKTNLTSTQAPPPVVLPPKPYEEDGIKITPITSPNAFPARFYDYSKAYYPKASQAADANLKAHGWRPTGLFEYIPSSGKFARWVVEA